MPISFRNLDGDLQGRIGSLYPDIGEVFYVVDSNFRTAAQGWSRADHTGPFDLWQERNPGYVYRTGDYGTDTLAIQAAVDAMIDYRGDTLLLTPGAYAIPAVVTFDVHYGRLLGVPSPNRQRRLVSWTGTIGNGLTVNALDIEVGYINFIPLTATNSVSIPANMWGHYWHDFTWDTRGVAANAATQLMTVVGQMCHCVFDKFVAIVDAAQGPMFELDGDPAVEGSEWTNFTLQCDTAAPWACALLDIDGDNVATVTVGPGRGVIGLGGSVTNLVTIANQTTNTVDFSVRGFRGNIGFCAANALVAQAGLAAEINIVDSYLDVVSGGVGGVGTPYTA